ncbi:hypothetical protein SNE40_000296 [Patella caerulea]|uniref:Protein kinase domain-containing protein n=1 Tax=Patella caerulea TaxID=87958 RepID=A0AAN8KA64_PATCE
MLEEGSLIGNQHGGAWKIIKKIGSGRCCQVYEGLDVVSKSQVAIKVYNEGLKFNCAHQREFLLLKIVHEKCGEVTQLVRMLESCCYGNQQVLIDEYLQPSLSVIIYTAKQQSHPSLFIIHKIINDVARGLSALHLCGFVHADLKPDNIQWSPKSGTFKLIDFGLSFNILDKEIGLVQSSSYRAPEVVCPNQPGNVPNTAIDIWSLGVLALYLVSEHKLTDYRKIQGLCAACQGNENKCENTEVVEKLFQQTTWHDQNNLFKKLKEVVTQCLQCQISRRPTCTDVIQQINTLTSLNAGFLDLLILPTCILRLLNMLGDCEIKNETELSDIKDDIIEECKKYGPVKDCIIPTDGPGINKVYVYFTSHIDAASAFTKLNGRTFNGRTVITTYFLPADFYTKNFF